MDNHAFAAISRRDELHLGASATPAPGADAAAAALRHARELVSDLLDVVGELRTELDDPRAARPRLAAVPRPDPRPITRRVRENRLAPGELREAFSAANAGSGRALRRGGARALFS